MVVAVLDVGDPDDLSEEEVVHVARRRGMAAGDVRQAADDVSAICHILPVAQEDMAFAIDILDDVPDLDTRDAVHLATAHRHGVQVAVTSDRTWRSWGAVRVVALGDAAELA